MDRKEIKRAVEEQGYDLLDLIGSGGFAQVYTVMHKKYNQVFALKVMNIGTDNTARLESYRNEVSSLEKLIHPNIIAIYKYFRDRKRVYMILEYCPNGSLKDVIEKNGPLGKKEFIAISRQILSALAYLHSRRVSHGDIKPANILFDRHNRPKLGDFGLADFQFSDKTLCMNYMCSPAFAPPEILRRIPYDPFLADMWSFGVTCYMCKVGNLPVVFSKNKEDFICAIEERTVWLINDDLDLKTIVDATLQRDPDNRLTADSILINPIYRCTLKSVARTSSRYSISLNNIGVAGAPKHNIPKSFGSTANIFSSCSLPGFKTKNVEYRLETFKCSCE